GWPGTAWAAGSDTRRGEWRGRDRAGGVRKQTGPAYPYDRCAVAPGHGVRVQRRRAMWVPRACLPGARRSARSFRWRIRLSGIVVLRLRVGERFTQQLLDARGLFEDPVVLEMEFRHPAHLQPPAQPSPDEGSRALEPGQHLLPLLLA